MGLNYHFHNVLCINVLHHLYRKMCEVSNLPGKQKSPKGSAEQQERAFQSRLAGGAFWGRRWDREGRERAEARITQVGVRTREMCV